MTITVEKRQLTAETRQSLWSDLGYAIKYKNITSNLIPYREDIIDGERKECVLFRRKDHTDQDIIDAANELIAEDGGRRVFQTAM